MSKGKFSKLNYGWNYTKAIGSFCIMIGCNKLYNSCIAILRFRKNMLTYYNDGFTRSLKYNKTTIFNWGKYE